MMKRGTNSLIKPISLHKQNPVYAKLVLLFTLLGITIFLFSSRSIHSSSPTLSDQKFDSPETDILIASESSDDDLETRTFTEVDDPEEAETALHTSDEASASSTSTELNNIEAKPKCELFKGNWVPNPSGPAYNNKTCHFIEPHQNCLRNGRPDTGYLYWKWKPNDCELPTFNPRRFLKFMRNKYFGFVGDSISRNHFQSILCTLSQVAPPKEIFRDAKNLTVTWKFPSYNFTISRIWSPFLLNAETFEDSNGVSTADIQLHVDKLEERWTKAYPKFDYMIISGVQWYMKTAIYYENNTVQGCHYCPGKNLTDIGFDVVYRKALSLVYNFITSSTHKPRILFRTISSSHFEGGGWSDGHCRREMPFKENEVNMTDVDQMLYDVQLQEFDKAVSKASETGIELKLFDTTGLSLLRPDGHPGEYRHYHPFTKDRNAKVQSDCLHWCTPGPIDSWNDLLMETLMNS